ncbi:MAG: host attachment protein [Acidiferrobacterales bacterium]|jgi:protein required for attachment to host cells|nr:host attachment protein [Acidiferrobacterales bacterium]
MEKTWILVANRGGARLFENTGPGKGMTLLRDIAHSEGHLKDQDFNADKPGRSFDSKGEGRHAMGKSESPKEHEIDRFAKELAHMCDKGRTSNEFTRLILVAEDRLLGLLKNELDHNTAKLVTDTVHKDLAHVADADVPATLEGSIKF